jgi:uncharacterized protein (DUF3820 family)
MSVPVRLSYKKTKNGLSLKILNVFDLADEVLGKLIQFVKVRRGELIYETHTINLLRRWDLEMTAKVFEESDIIVEFERIEETLPLHKHVLEFGKYKGWKWENVPDDYIDWMVSANRERTIHWNLAYAEHKRRRFCSTFNPTETIPFGKYKGTRWSDLEMSYLDWLIDNLEESNTHLDTARAARAYKNQE